MFPVSNRPLMALLPIVTFLALAFGSFARAQTKLKPAPLSTSKVEAVAASPLSIAPNPHSLTSEDLEAFFDGVIPLQLERSDVAGATVLVMKDGKTLLQKGYGYADLKSRRPVDPASTIFRLASISKLFTWVSVMQLAEEGKLDIDADINQYLDFQIRPMTGVTKPITLRNLMTHTGGFENTIRGIIVTDARYSTNLRDFLIQNQPNRLFAPGTVPAYSNYGVGLASYIVQRTSGEPFQQYVADHTFLPLGMSHSTFYQPPPKLMEKLPSQGYPSSTEKAPLGFETFNPVGAGGVSSTAIDMGRFGQALLNGGELDGHRILKPETLTAMWQPQFRASDQLPPLCMGFYQTWRNDLRWIGHEGDLIGFHSLFFLESREKLVLFISYNSTGSENRTRTELVDLFTDRYYPQPLKHSFISMPISGLKEIEGTYQSTRRADSTILKLFALAAQSHLTVDKDGVLKSDRSKDLRNHIAKWKPIGKDLWQEVDEQDKLFAIRDTDGHIIRLAGDFPGVQSERVPWYERDHLIFPALGSSLLVGLSVLVATLLTLGRRIFLRNRQPWQPRPGTLRLTRIPRIAAIFWVVLFSAVGVLFSRVSGDDALPPSPAWDKYILLGDVLFVTAVLLSVFAVVSAIRLWRHRSVRTITQVKFSLVALACIFFSWFAIHWNLIGPFHRI